MQDFLLPQKDESKSHGLPKFASSIRGTSYPTKRILRGQ